MTRRGSSLAIISLVWSVIGCNTYVASLTVRSEQATETGASQPSFGEAAEHAAHLAVSRIAENDDMRLVAGPYDPRFTDPYRLLVLFKAGDVSLSAQIKNDRSEIVFSITDQAHGGDTEFTSSLQRALEEQVANEFPGSEVVWTRSAVVRNPLAP